jgi:uncharacterized membrane protein
MNADISAAVAFFAALGSGLMADLFFAFSVSVMRALRRLPERQGIEAMHTPRALCLLVGSLCRGSFMVTILCNVPLNKALASVPAESPETSGLWASYLSRWTAWNHVRTLASLVAAAPLSWPCVRGSTHRRDR